MKQGAKLVNAVEQLAAINKARDDIRTAEERVADLAAKLREARKSVPKLKARLIAVIDEQADIARQPRIPFDEVNALPTSLGGSPAAGFVETKPAAPVMEFQPGASSDSILNRDWSKCTRCNEQPVALVVRTRARKSSPTIEEMVCAACAGPIRKDKSFAGEGPLPETMPHPDDLRNGRMAPPEPTWRKMTLEVAGYTQGEDSFEIDVCDALVSAGVRTCGELADRLLAGEMFDLLPQDLDPVYAAIEMLSEDDETPIDFDAHFARRTTTEAPFASVGDIVRTSYGTGPYVIESIGSYGTRNGRPTFSMNLSEANATAKKGKRQPKGTFILNDCQRVEDGRILGFNSRDEIVVLPKGSDPGPTYFDWCQAAGLVGRNGEPELQRLWMLGQAAPDRHAATADAETAKPEPAARPATTAKVWNVFDRRHPDKALGQLTGSKRHRAHAAALKQFPGVMASEVVIQPASDGDSLKDRSHAIPNVVADPLAIACPTCEAAIGQQCKTLKGKPKELCLHRKLAPETGSGRAASAVGTDAIAGKESPPPAGPMPPVTKPVGSLPLSAIPKFPANLATQLDKFRGIKTLQDLEDETEFTKKSIKEELPLRELIFETLSSIKGTCTHVEVIRAADAVVAHLDVSKREADPKGDHILFTDVKNFPQAAAEHLNARGIILLTHLIPLIERERTRGDHSPIFAALRALDLGHLLGPAGDALVDHFGPDRFAAVPKHPAPPIDRTHVWEQRVENNGDSPTLAGQDVKRIAAQIADYRKRDNDTGPDGGAFGVAAWGQWCEFDVKLANGSPLRCVSKPEWNGVRSLHHVEWWSPTGVISPTGYWSETVDASTLNPSAMQLDEWATKAARLQTDAFRKEQTAKSDAKPKPKRATKASAG